MDEIERAKERTARTEAVEAARRAVRSLTTAGLLLAGPGRIPKESALLEDLREAVGHIRRAAEAVERIGKP